MRDICHGDCSALLADFVNLLEILTGPLALRGNSLFMRQAKEPNRADVVTWHQQITNCLTEGTDQDVERVMHQVYADFLADYQRYSVSPEGNEDEGAPREAAPFPEAKGSLLPALGKQVLASGMEGVQEGEIKADSLPVKGRSSKKAGVPRKRALA